MGKDHKDDDHLPAPQQEQDDQTMPTRPTPEQEETAADTVDSHPGKTRQEATPDVDEPALKTVQVKGWRIRIDQQTTIRQIKELIDVSDDNLAYLRTDDDLKALNDADRPYEYVDDEDRLTFRSGATKNPFGAPRP